MGERAHELARSLVALRDEVLRQRTGLAERVREIAVAERGERPGA
jgi:hypothetical protein